MSDIKMRFALITLGSTLATTAVIINAFYQKKQFYPSVVYLTKSNPCIAVLYVQAFVAVFLVGKLLRKIFFGQLRAAELEHLIEKFWYVITETCLAFTVFRDDFSSKFVALFTFLLFMKAFHWLIEDRVDYMERTPVISWIFHLRVLGLLSFLGTLDSILIHHAFRTTIASGASVQMVFGFEYSILLTMVVAISMKYVLHSVDNQHENPWENKNVYLLYADLVTGFVKCILYILFVGVMVKIHTFPLFAIRPMYLTIRAFKKSLSDVILSRRAISYMNTRFPDATEQELLDLDNTCIICREQLNSGKKLPCNHIFHTHCLRSWFQRQQSCPTCRLDVLSNMSQNQEQNQQIPQQRPQQNQPPTFPQPGIPNNMGMNNFVFPPGGPPSFMQHPSQQEESTNASAQSASASTAIPPMFGPLPQMPFPPHLPFGNTMFQPFMSIPPYADLSKLSDVKLKEMEGQERVNVEARIRVLRNIHTLLDTAILQLNQYSHVIQNINSLSDFQTSSQSTSSANPNVFGSDINGMDGGATASFMNIPNGVFGVGTDFINSSNQSSSKTKKIFKSDDSEIENITVSESSSETLDQENEIRKRRLEKFQTLTRTNDGESNDSE